MKIESLAGLFNGLFLIVVSVNLFAKSLERIQMFNADSYNIENEIQLKYTTEMILVSIGGLIINLVGLAFFHENEEQNENIYGLFLHVLADTLGSVGVLVSCYLVTNYNIAIADPICAMIVSIMIFVSVLPLIKMSCEGLLL
jgi:zinc transporter 5/7